MWFGSSCVYIARRHQIAKWRQDYAFFASRSALRRARLRMSMCIPLFWSRTALFMVPVKVARAQCMIPWAQYGVLVAAIP